MLNFLNPAVIIAAAAALIPLLIHLFSKRKVKIIEFSSIRHLKEMRKRQVRRIKIRQILLLRLRMLIILVAVLAFARPASKGGYIGSHAGVSAAILFDRSASMLRQVKDGQLLDLAKKSIDDLMTNFGQADEVILIPFDRKTYFPAGERLFSKDVAENVLSNISPGYEESNLGDALEKSLELLSKGKNYNKELYVATDWQLNSFPESVSTAGDNVTFYTFDLPLETDGNCGIVDLDMGGQLISVGNAFTIKADIKNYDSFAKSEMLASLFIDGIRVVQTEFSVSEKGQETVRFKHTVSNPGFHYGWIEISDDGFLPDNKRYFSFSIPEQFNILIIEGDNGGQLIRLALIPSEELARYWSVKNIDTTQLPAVKFSDYDAVVLAGVGGLSDMETSRLLNYISNGGSLLYICGEDINPEHFNPDLGEKFGLYIEAPPPSDFSRAGYYSLERLDYSHPILAPFDSFQKDSLPVFRFFALPRVRDKGSNRDLAFFSNGAPAIVESVHGRGKIIMLTAPLTPRFTDISSHSFIVPFLIRTLEYLAGGVSAYEQAHYVGDNITRSLPEKKVRYGSVKMIAPDAREYEIPGREIMGQVLYDCRPIDVPGIYQLISNGKVIDLFPVNVPPMEGDLTSADYDMLTDRLGFSDPRIIPYEKSAADIISEARFGRELWKVFLWAVAVLLAIEMFLARRTKSEIEES